VSRKSGVRATEPLAFFARAGGERMMMAGPAAARGVDSDPLVGQLPVRLIDRGLGRKAARRGVALTGRLDRKAKRCC
jgi:hypothetical protein